MAHVLPRKTPRNLKRLFRAVLLLLFSVTTFGVAGTRPAISVTVNNRTVGVFDGTSVAEAMGMAGVSVRDGMLYSAGKQVVLDRSHEPPGIWVDGRAAGKATRLRDGAQVRAEDGADSWERVETEQIPIPAGLPEVEHRLWNAGQAGMEVVSRGVRSGEVLSRRNEVPMVPAAPEAMPVVALTFDDGPDPRWTIPILQNLKREDIKATFCVVGRQARKYPEIIGQILADGHVLCDHSETHPAGLSKLSNREIDLEVGSPAFFLGTLSGVRPSFFRAPGGSINDFVIRAAKSRNMRILAWSVDPRDFEGPPPGDIQATVMARVKPGSVILLHDGGGIRSNTVAALPGLITQLRAAGYGFRTP